VSLALCTLAPGMLIPSAQAKDGADLRLIDAVRNSDMSVVRAMIKQRVDVNASLPDGATALHWAVYEDEKEAVDLLIRAGARVNTANELGATPLWVACAEGRAAMIDVLLRAGADPNLALHTGETPLMTLARTGNLPAVRRLLASGANVNAKESSRSQTALMWAISERHSDVASMLVEFGADVNARTSVRRMLVNSGADGTARVSSNRVDLFDEEQGGFTPILFAARDGDAASARMLLEKGANANDKTPTGATTLVIAAFSLQPAVASVLLDHGADPNASGAGYTALHAAILRDDAGLVSALLSHGADPNAVIAKSTPTRRSSEDWAINPAWVGVSPLWLASKFSEPDIMRLLAKAGANTHFARKDGTSVLMASLERGPGRHGLIGLLSADPVQVQREGLEAIKAALEIGCDVNAPTPTGDTILHAAAARRFNQIVQFLAENGAKLNVKNKRGQTPLDVAQARPPGPPGALAGGGPDAPPDTSTADLLRKLGAVE
jgi:uncharacterized protein